MLAVDVRHGEGGDPFDARATVIELIEERGLLRRTFLLAGLKVAFSLIVVCF